MARKVPQTEQEKYISKETPKFLVTWLLRILSGAQDRLTLHELNWLGLTNLDLQGNNVITKFDNDFCWRGELPNKDVKIHPNTIKDAVIFTIGMLFDRLLTKPKTKKKVIKYKKKSGDGTYKG